MPQSHKIIATKTVSGEVHVFDYFKHGGTPSSREVKPDMRLTGHSKEGYGLDWSPHDAGLLLSGSDDKRICLWDINQSNVSASSVQPVHAWEEHEKEVEDVAWN